MISREFLWDSRNKIWTGRHCYHLIIIVTIQIPSPQQTELLYLHLLLLHVHGLTPSESLKARAFTWSSQKLQPISMAMFCGGCNYRRHPIQDNSLRNCQFCNTTRILPNICIPPTILSHKWCIATVEQLEALLNWRLLTQGKSWQCDRHNSSHP